MASSALVRMMYPPFSPGGSRRCNRSRSRARSDSSSMRCEMPMCGSCGRYTSMRPARLTCVDSRAPLVPMGSLITCTSSVSPSWISRSIGGGFSWVNWRNSQMSATWRKAARSSPMSTKADCMPGSTRATRPRKMLPTRPRVVLRSTCSSCTTPASSTATRVSWGVMLMRMSSIGRASVRIGPAHWPDAACPPLNGRALEVDLYSSLIPAWVSMRPVSNRGSPITPV